MATTTNYSWDTPDDTDLVKDGAAAIRTLGSSIDTTTKALNPSTTLGDIEYRSSTANTNTRLGIGTTGQVLAVVGGVPAWATTADQTPLTTKGDIFTFTTVDARLGVGANGTVLTADSAEATGLKWATPSGGLTYAAWTPTTAGITVGNGTIVARYAQSGKFVTGSFNFTFGSTSAITGFVNFTLPVTAKATFVDNTTATFLRTGVGYNVGTTISDTTTIYVGALVTSTAYGSFVDLSSTIPHTWGNGDFISVNFSYEAA